MLLVLELAVLVFIHGDSWLWGSASTYDGRVLATLGKVLVVTFNFRLGVLGKFCFANINYRRKINLISFNQYKPFARLA